MAAGLGLKMNNFPAGFRALVIGSTGAIGAALLAQLEAMPGCAAVVGLHRHSVPPIDFEREDSIASAATALASQAPFHLIVNAAGLLHADGFMPEKKLAELNYAQMQATFQVNSFGPALLLRHFAGLLARERGLLALLSAKVGSIEDNRLGGWYSYRASKAALNMLVKTAAIEIKRSQPQSVVVAVHPGTVKSKLSKPFRGLEIGREPSVAAAEILTVLDRLLPADSGKFFSYSGERLPW
jgi:NAD(P)-dependent dehydrogenase (short-subunit alcohol dehydrogenase family)